MDHIEELFVDLESNNLVKVEEAKRRITESFGQTKDPWLVCGMIDYFKQTKSSRIVDILVKVQTPHDKFVFDRLAEWIHGPNKNVALSLFGHIVKKHPSWLYKIETHQLFKDILKLLKTEQNILSIMSALFCIIILLPIIPKSIPKYLPDLFDVFMYLASWHCSNTPRLLDVQLIHLKMGLSIYFQRLYGMFPCNFTSYIQNYVIKENSAVFMHTIKPLLETVKMHPMLLIGNRESEKNPSRWKDMEPHDVVVECSKFSLHTVSKVQELPMEFPTSFRSQDCTAHGNVRTPVSVQLQNSLKNTPYSAGSPFYSLFNEVKENHNESQRIDNIWSPSVTVLATPPPSGNIVPHTPTPTPSTQSYGIVNLPVSQLCASGSSPPEAAVEATPETTPMKDNIKSLRQLPTNSTASRAIYGSTLGSQPSSPMKKEPPSSSNTLFRFAEQPADQIVVVEQNPLFSSPKLMNLVNERNMIHMQMINDGLHQHQRLSSAAGDAGLRPALHDSPVPVDSTNEDLEVTEINRNVHKIKRQNSTEHTDTASGLHITSSTALPNYSQRFKQWQRHNVRDPESVASEYSKSLPAAPSFMLDMRKSGFTYENGESSPLETDENDEDETKRLPRRQDALQNQLLRSKRKNFADHNHMASVGTQTIEQSGQFILEAIYSIPDSSVAIKSSETPISPQLLLDQYIETSIRKKHLADTTKADNYRDQCQVLMLQIELLYLQLQYERYRREVHSERNRRLLGKSRANAALEMDNDKLKEQREKLTIEVEVLTANRNKVRIAMTQQDKEHLLESGRLRKDVQREGDENRQLRVTIEQLQRRITEEKTEKKDCALELEGARAEIFDLRNQLQQALQQAALGQHHKEELNRVRVEMLLMGEIQIKCRDKIGELDNLKLRDAQLELIQESYKEEVRDMRFTLDQKSAMLDTSKARLCELESQLSRKDSMFTEQKRLLKMVKEEYQEKFNALEAKYAAQKAIILRLEEEMLELYKNHSAVNLATLSPDSDKTDIGGSLDHNSSLSISLASSEGLSMSLKSVSEIRNLHPLVSQTDDERKSNRITTTANFATTTANFSGSSRQPASQDIPVPGTSQHHLHK